MAEFKSYYCKKCKCERRHQRLMLSDSGGNILERGIQNVLDKGGFTDFLNFLENEYNWKCTKCGRKTWRKSDGTEKYGFS